LFRAAWLAENPPPSSTSAEGPRLSWHGLDQRTLLLVRLVNLAVGALGGKQMVELPELADEDPTQRFIQALTSV
jgi:hypothetical protein